MGSKIAEAFRLIEGRHESLADLDLAMRKVRMEVFGVLAPETKIRDLYEIAQENGWITLEGDAYIVSVSIPEAKPKWHSCPHCAMSVTDGGRCGCPGEVIAERDQLRDELEARKRDSVYITPVGSVHGSAEAITYVVDTLNDLETDLAEAKRQLAQAKAIARDLAHGVVVLDAANPNPVTDAEFEAFMRDPGEVEVVPLVPFLPAFSDASDPASEIKQPAQQEGPVAFPGRVIGGPDAPHVGYDSKGKAVTVGEHFQRSVSELPTLVPLAFDKDWWDTMARFRDLLCGGNQALGRVHAVPVSEEVMRRTSAQELHNPPKFPDLKTADCIHRWELASDGLNIRCCKCDTEQPVVERSGIPSLAKMAEIVAEAGKGFVAIDPGKASFHEEPWSPEMEEFITRIGNGGDFTHAEKESLNREMGWVVASIREREARTDTTAKREPIGEEAADRMRGFVNSLDRDSALAFLQKAGIVGADGKLTEHYRD